MDPDAVSNAALAFNIIGTLLWVPDMLYLFGPDGSSRLTGLVILLEDIPQLVFAGVYIQAVLTTTVYGGDSGCEDLGPLPLDPVVVVSLVGSAIGLLFNLHLVCSGDDSKLVG